MVDTMQAEMKVKSTRPTIRQSKRHRHAMVLGSLFVSSVAHCDGFSISPKPKRRQHQRRVDDLLPLNARQQHHYTDTFGSSESTMNRREALAAGFLSAALTTTCLPRIAKASTDSCGLESIVLGDGKWTTTSTRRRLPSSFPLDKSIVPHIFSTYAARFLFRYDDGVSSWWKDIVKSCSLLSEERRCFRLEEYFGQLARSFQISIQASLREAPSLRDGYEDLIMCFLEHYGNDKEARRQIGLLFALLPQDHQPVKHLSQISAGPPSFDLPSKSPDTDNSFAPPTAMQTDYTALLPPIYRCVRVRGTDGFTIYPTISLDQLDLEEEPGQIAVVTAFGPLAAHPLQRELPQLNSFTYALFGISGAAGCALTHTVVIPLDVVKTRMQTDQALTVNGGSMLNCAASIIETEGLSGLLMGSQATIIGYIWYGLSVYPSYTFIKRWICQSLLSPELVMVHDNNIALLAGALSAVIASLGLAPMEAARIRAVADPDMYRPKGLLGTLQVIATEDNKMGWKTLYAGLPSLLTRQVLFGSIKFLAFERACESIFHVFPGLHDQMWTSFMVSLVAGGLSGCLSSVVSHPADAVLTFVAQNSNVGVLEGSRIMVEKDGIGSLFRGLGSRCVWAGSIIAGQFLLYDVFRTYFGVNGNDLAQVFEIVISRS